MARLPRRLVVLLICGFAMFVIHNYLVFKTALNHKHRNPVITGGEDPSAIERRQKVVQVMFFKDYTTVNCTAEPYSS